MSQFHLNNVIVNSHSNYNIYNNNKKNKEKEVISNTIYINPSYNKTPKIYRFKEKINKKTNAKSNKNNNKKKK